jgi:hypothetical protein
VTVGVGVEVFGDNVYNRILLLGELFLCLCTVVMEQLNS